MILKKTTKDDEDFDEVSKVFGILDLAFKDDGEIGIKEDISSDDEEYLKDDEDSE